MTRRALALVAVTAALALPGWAGSASAATPPGTIVAKGLTLPTNIAFDPAGGMWITTGTTGERVSTDGVWHVSFPGAAPVQVVPGLYSPLGLTWYGGELYVASIVGFTTGIVTAYSDFDGRTFLHHRVVLPYVPVGRFTLDSIVPGPGGRLYMGVGAERDHQRSGHAQSGTVLSFRPDGTGERIEARGFRDPFGIAFIPGTRALLVDDDGRDDLGLLRAPEELNVVPDVARGGARDFGFPDCWGQGGQACHGTLPAIVRFPAHASTAGLVVAPATVTHGPTAYVAENGSSLSELRVGDDIRIVRLRRTLNGLWRGKKVGRITGFAHRDPLGLALGPDGALYLTLLISGEVLRIPVR